ncbi:MAG: COG1361 S-layer family protein [Candidatus Nanohaloarchaea archaeon]|nr:COG1361 S-layer family protein [Candidatus Nanohaloarchaea archaeon]
MVDMGINVERLLVLAVFLALVLPAASAQRKSVDVDVQKIKTEPVPLQTSEYADIWLKVENNGSLKAEDVTLEYKPTFPFSVDPDEQTRWNIGTLYSGQTYHVHLQVKVDENAVSGTNRLEFRWTSGTGDTWITEKVPVEVRTDDAALAVREVGFPANVAPGTSNTMTLTVENLADSYLKNIDVSLDLSGLPFATAETTRERIQKLAPGKTSEVSFTLVSDQSAENGVYKLPITLQYENEAGTSFTREQTTGIVVGGSSNLQVSVDERDLYTPGSTGSVTFRIVNRGQGEASFVSMQILPSEDYEVLSARSVYLGDMEPDAYQTAAFDIHTSNTVSNLTVPVKLEYRDSGVQKEEVRRISLRLYTPDEMKRFNLAGGGNTVLYVLVALAVLAAAGVYWRRRKRRQV